MQALADLLAGDGAVPVPAPHARERAAVPGPIARAETRAAIARIIA